MTNQSIVTLPKALVDAGVASTLQHQLPVEVALRSSRYAWYDAESLSSAIDLTLKQ